MRTMMVVSTIATSEDMEAAFAIRREVFCVEQGVSEADEIDGLDPACRHYLAWLNGRPIGTARVREAANGSTKIERVAVLASARGVGHGAALMHRIMEDARNQGARSLVLNAQRQAEGFYARLGFRTEGGEFDEAGIPHVRMVWKESGTETSR